jgi:hypothetical protein
VFNINGLAYARGPAKSLILLGFDLSHLEFVIRATVADRPAAPRVCVTALHLDFLIIGAALAIIDAARDIKGHFVFTGHLTFRLILVKK